MASEAELEKYYATLAEARLAQGEVRKLLYTLHAYQSRGGSGASLTPSEGDFFDPEKQTRTVKASLHRLAQDHAPNFKKEFEAMNQEALFDLGCLGASVVFGSLTVLDQANKVDSALSKRIQEISLRISEANSNVTETEANQRANGALGLMSNSRYMKVTSEDDIKKNFEALEKLRDDLKNQEVTSLVNKANNAVTSSTTKVDTLAGVSLWPIRSATALFAKMKNGLLSAGYPGTLLYCNPARNSIASQELKGLFDEARQAAATLRESTPLKIDSKATDYPTPGQAYLANDESCKRVVKEIESQLAKLTSMVGSGTGAANVASFKHKYDTAKASLAAATDSNSISRAYSDLRLVMVNLQFAVENQSNQAKKYKGAPSSKPATGSSSNEADIVRNPTGKRS